MQITVKLAQLIDSIVVEWWSDNNSEYDLSKFVRQRLEKSGFSIETEESSDSGAKETLRT